MAVDNTRPSRVRVHFFVCTNARPEGSPLPSCGGQGGAAIYQAFTRELSRRGWPSGVKATATGCLTPCQCGPNVVVYPAGVWYAGLDVGDVPALLDCYLDGMGDVSHLELDNEVVVT